jgi:hypothetical protein
LIRLKPIDSPLYETSWNWLFEFYFYSNSSDVDLHKHQPDWDRGQYTQRLQMYKTNLISLELLSRIRVIDKAELFELLLTVALGISENCIGADR